MKEDNWISVKDRLPELRKNVWDNEDECYKSEVLIYVIGYDGEYIYSVSYSEWGLFDSHNENITHWMPFPEPPTCTPIQQESEDELWNEVLKVLGTADGLFNPELITLKKHFEIKRKP